MQIIVEPKVFHFRSDQKNDNDINSPTQSFANTNEYATEGLVAHFVRYVPNCIGAEVVFTLNQVFTEVSQNGRNHDAGNGIRTNSLAGDSRDRYECSIL